MMLGARAWLPKSALLAKEAFVPAAKWLKLGTKLSHCLVSNHRV